MITKFSQKTQDALGVYIYAYYVGVNKQLLYIGKGKGNRAFQHPEIGKKYPNCEIDILAHNLSNDKDAEIVENTVIEAIGLDSLEFNAVKSRRSIAKIEGMDVKLGRAGVDEFEYMFSGEEISDKDVEDDIVRFHINESYRPNMSEREIYDATRTAWKIKLDNARRAKYALGVAFGVIEGVYEIAEWLPAGQTVFDRSHGEEGRFEFVGRLAPPEIQKRYLHKKMQFTQSGYYAGPFWRDQRKYKQVQFSYKRQSVVVRHATNGTGGEVEIKIDGEAIGKGNMKPFLRKVLESENAEYRQKDSTHELARLTVKLFVKPRSPN